MAHSLFWSFFQIKKILNFNCVYKFNYEIRSTVSSRSLFCGNFISKSSSKLYNILVFGFQSLKLSWNFFLNSSVALLN
jgi:hypothetical protein